MKIGRVTERSIGHFGIILNSIGAAICFASLILITLGKRHHFASATGEFLLPWGVMWLVIAITNAHESWTVFDCQSDGLSVKRTVMRRLVVYSSYSTWAETSLVCKNRQGVWVVANQKLLRIPAGSPAFECAAANAIPKEVTNSIELTGPAALAASLDARQVGLVRSAIKHHLKIAAVTMLRDEAGLSLKSAFDLVNEIKLADAQTR